MRSTLKSGILGTAQAPIAVKAAIAIKSIFFIIIILEDKRTRKQEDKKTRKQENKLETVNYEL
jgi:hypothetical protein